MDLLSIINSITETIENVKNGNKDSTMFNQDEFFNAADVQLKKHAGEPLAKFCWISPVMLNFPFNPIDAKDTTFNSRNKFLLKTDALSGWLAIKEIMRTNKELHEMYAKLLGVSVEEYSLEPVIEYLPDGTSYEYVSKEDMQLINLFKIPVQLSLFTQKMTTVATGKYGREFRTPLRLDGEGQILEEDTNTVAYMILKLEQQIRAEKLGYFNLNHEGITLTSDDKDNKEAIRKSMQISYPRLSGVTLMQELVIDKSTNKLATLAPEEASFDKTLVYSNCAKKFLEQLQRLIGKKDDYYPNYLLIKVSYGNVTDKNSPEYYIKLHDSREIVLNDLPNWRHYTKKYIDYFMEKESIKSVDKAINALAKAIKFSDPRAMIGQTTLSVGDTFHDPLTGEEREANELDVQIARIQDFDRNYMEYNAKGMEGKYETIIKSNVMKYRYLADSAMFAAYAPRVAEIRQFITPQIFEEFGKLLSKASPATYAELKDGYNNNRLAISFANTIAGTGKEATKEETMKALEEMNKLDVQEALEGDLPEEDTNDAMSENINNIPEGIEVKTVDLA